MQRVFVIVVVSVALLIAITIMCITRQCSSKSVKTPLLWMLSVVSAHSDLQNWLFHCNI